jgi:methylenetetrahydrofolate reductase (NADPH)
MTVRVSFEVFPPKTEPGLDGLGRAVHALQAVEPVYISVTYGAGGGQRDKSFAAIDTVRTSAADVPVAAHLTCVGQTRDEIEKIVARYAELGVQHIVALRGDPPEGIDAPYTAHPDGFQSTAELVAAIKARGDFEIAVSAYPEKHPQSPSEQHDLDVLAAKVDAGASFAMTQMFFDNDLFLRLRDRVADRGIPVTVVPGIFPIHSFEAVARFARRCGASMPAALPEAFAGFTDDPADQAAATDLAADLAALQIAHLAAEGVTQAHLYTLNKSELALAVCARLGITPRRPPAPQPPTEALP